MEYLGLPGGRRTKGVSHWLVVRSLTLHRRQNVSADALSMQAGNNGVRLPLRSGGAAVSDKALERAGGEAGALRMLPITFS